MTITLGTIALDAPDIRAMADFYTRILGWSVLDEDDDWITIHDPQNPAGAEIAFQRAPDFVAPTWPNNAVPQQAHLDLNVDDLDAAEATVLAAGARATGMPSEPGHNWRTYLDPAGHPFCLCEH